MFINDTFIIHTQQIYVPLQFKLKHIKCVIYVQFKYKFHAKITKMYTRVQFCKGRLAEVALFAGLVIIASKIVACTVPMHSLAVRPSSRPCNITCGIFWLILSFSGSGPKGLNIILFCTLIVN